MTNPKIRFDEFIHKADNGCWLWTGPTCSGGRYGRMLGNHHPMLMAHRYSYQAHVGEIPPRMLICHTCDNGLCVNPSHLFLGTSRDNNRDCKVKGRMKLSDEFLSRQGQPIVNPKRNPEIAQRNRAIRAEREAGATYPEICRRYGLKSKGHLRQILLQQESP